MQVILSPCESGNCLATIAIGKKYYDDWSLFALPGWIEYCKKNRLGLVVFDEHLIEQGHNNWKKPTWQKMLIGECLSTANLKIINVCYLDSDILISPLAPNIFDNYEPDYIGLTSIRKNLPFPLEEVKRRLAFLRHVYYSKDYPLDSALFMTLEQLYQYHNLAVQPDEACMGLIVFNVKNHAQLMRGWFDSYDKNVHSITGGGDQTHINYEIQNWGKVTWLDYRFQAIWVYEMAWKYPFLYELKNQKKEIVKNCVEASLLCNYFLHFAGSWYESEMWKIDNIMMAEPQKELLNSFIDYLNRPVYGNPVGFVKPTAVSSTA